MSPPAYSSLASRARIFSSPVFLPAARLRFFLGFSCAAPPDVDPTVAAAAAASLCGVASRDVQVVLPLIVRPENRRRLVQNLPGRGRDW